MRNYQELLLKVINEGEEKSDRTGTGTYSLFGEQLRFDLSKGFPLLTTKKVHFKSVVTELLWMLRGDTNVAYLHEHGCTIWDEWAKPGGSLGPVYGKQWRTWECSNNPPVDQIAELIEGIRSNPDGRRHLVSAWNPEVIESMALPPCHCLMQFYVAGNRLSCHMYQRSADIFIGLPFNIASYALLTNLLALELHLDVGDLIVSFGDIHLYRNHFVQAQEQLLRQPRELPSLGVHFKPGALLYRKGDGDKRAQYTPSDIFVGNYNPHPAIKAPVAV